VRRPRLIRASPVGSGGDLVQPAPVTQPQKLEVGTKSQESLEVDT